MLTLTHKNNKSSIMLQMKYEGPEGRDFWFTTEANIIPEYFPWPDCSGQNCTGILK
jgi:hypothetical protein